MSDTHNKLSYANNYNHWKILDLVLDLNYLSFSNPYRNLNPTHSSKHKTLNPNHQFSQHIWYVEYYSVHAHLAWSQKFRLTPDIQLANRIVIISGRYELRHQTATMDLQAARNQLVAPGVVKSFLRGGRIF